MECCLDRGAHRNWTVKTGTGLQKTRGIFWFPFQLSTNVAQAEKEAEMMSKNSSPEWQGSRSVAADLEQPLGKPDKGGMAVSIQRGYE